MPPTETLAGLLAEVDDDSLSAAAAAFDRRSERLANGDAQDQAWSAVFGYLAAQTDVALMLRRTGVAA